MLKRSSKAPLFIGISITLLGLLVITYDYPQLQFFENLERSHYEQLSDELREKHGRLELEFSIGVGFVTTGLLVTAFGLLKTVSKR